MTISIISTPITAEITPGSGNYAANITITNTGIVTAPQSIAVYGISDFLYSTLINDGVIVSKGTAYAVDINSASLINYGTISGVLLDNFSTVSNFGTILALGAEDTDGIGLRLIDFDHFTNQGSILASVYLALSYLHNQSIITGSVSGNDDSIINQGSISGGVKLDGFSTLLNSGTITNGMTFAATSIDDVVTNSGLISGSTDGIYAAVFTTITNSGTISGATDAILSTGSLALTIESGAVFNGAVVNSLGFGTIILGGTAAEGVSLTSQFSGFNSIAFAAGTTATLSGSTALLANGQTITGFATGDTIILEGFAATSETFNQATGLILSNATGSQTLSIEGPPYNADFTATSQNGNTTLTVQEGPVSTITGTISHEVTLGVGFYPFGVSITSSGAITNANGSAIYGVYKNSFVSNTSYFLFPTLTNDGLIEGGGSQYAALLTNGTLTNAGTIIGHNGVALVNSTASNRGLIAASFSLGTALELRGGSFTNSGLINGGISLVAAAYLDNTGTVNGAVYDNAEITNKGIINGLVSIGRSGGFTNTGTIAGGITITAPAPNSGFYGGQLINNGLISGTGITFGGTGGITDTGTIIGSTYAILATGNLALTIESGALFEGKVEHTGSGNGTIILGGSTAVGLSLGSQFTGFDTFSFANATSGTLEGGITALAAGQTITGFTNGDKLILDGFAATSETFNQATGITLSNGSTNQTLGVAGLPYNAAFSLTNNGGNTTLTVQDGPVSLVSSTIATQVTLGTGNYPASLTITSTGAALAGVTANYGTENFSSGAAHPPTLVNQGLISGPGGQYAVQFNSEAATLTNSGTIIGYDGLKLQYDEIASNSGLIAATGSDGKALFLVGSLSNSGTIQGRVTLYGGDLINTGSLTGPVDENIGTVNNQGQITGAFDLMSGVFINSGTLGSGINQNTFSPNYTVTYAYITNTGLITGTSIGISLASPAPNGFDSASTITNAGTIAGGTYAILATGRLALTVESGAVFNGAVKDSADTGTIILGGASENFTLTSQFTGFDAFGFATGTAGTLTGTTAELASGETIQNFATGDTIILDGFAATSETFNHATGLTLSNGTQTETLGLTGLPFDTQFTLATDGTNTTITAPVAPVSLISTSFTGEVVPGNGDYASNLTITNTGTLINTGTAALADTNYGTVPVSTILNAGTIDVTGAVAVTLSGHVTLTNTGLISGGVSGGLWGYESALYNDGLIIGTSVGVTGELYLDNTGTISASTGISLVNGYATNAGTIAGALYAVQAEEFAEIIVDPGAVFQGNIAETNGTGQLILAATTVGSLDLTGTVTGFDIDFGLASHWTLEGGASALATGQTIGGFVAGDTIILDNFAATSESFNQTIGLILSNGTSTETLALSGAPSGANFSLSTAGGNTTIAPLFAPVSLITGTIANQLALAGADYATSVTITSTGLLLNGLYSGYTSAGTTITNLGTIGTTNSTGIFMSGPAALTNDNQIATYITAEAANILNRGIITDNSAYSNFSNRAAIVASYGSSILNTGIISDTESRGVSLDKSTLTNIGVITGNLGVNATLSNVINTGTISGQAGINATASTITNTGTIDGAYGGLYLFQTTLTNSGHIFGGEATTFGFVRAAGIGANGGVINNTGSIGGFSFGIYAYEAMSITNAGTISGDTDAIYAIGTIDLTVDPGAVFNGDVVDRYGTGTLILAGTTSGAIDLSDPITGFSNITFAQGAHWSLAGTSAELAGGETISGFTLGDTIALTDFTPTSSTFVTGTGLVLSNGTTTETLNLAGNFTNAAFAVSNGAVAALCFARGTKIHTPKGKRRIETLQIGDKILTRDGTAETIKWIGRRSYDGRFIANNHLALPVTIKAHALAKNIPSRDLTVSPGHGIFLSGVLIPAWRLINGVTITQAAQIEKIDYFHIELDRHSVILAENCPAESFLDIGLRQQFHNAAEYTGTPNTQATPLPRLEEGFLLQTIQRRLGHRAGIQIWPEPTGPLRGCVDEASPTAIRGWANCPAAPDTPISLDIFADGVLKNTILANAYRPDLREAGLGSGCHGFALPGLSGQIEIRRTLDSAPLARPQARAA
jgi:hypothetical protein